MSNPHHSYDLLKSIVQLSTSSIPIQVKLDQILQAISGTFQSNRCLFLKPEQIKKSAFFSRLASEKKPLWVEEGTFFQKENVVLEEEDLLCPTFACIPLVVATSFQGILYIGFSKNHRFSPEEVDLLLLIGEVIGGAIRNEDLHHKAEETISELTTLYEMGNAGTSTLKLENLFELIVTTGLKILKAKGGVLRVEDRRAEELEVKWSMGDYHQNPFDEKLARRVFHSQTPLSLNPSAEEGFMKRILILQNSMRRISNYY